ncbi:MAG: SDR family NAD(P)-dependent oxidoreductase [Burkholderiaceae bacterium]|nr:SDR family NAD(P)-dependent oxidoreductase [Burkholderiaceae bacterium]
MPAKTLFADQIALVTGAASGIGRALAWALARRGAEVVLADLHAEAAEAVAAAIRQAGGRAQAHALDVRDTAAVAAFVAGIAADKGRLDYLFNNAGIAVLGEWRDFAASDWQRILAVNLDGVMAGTAAAYAVMLRQGSGHIVNTASLAGLVPSPGLVAYAASKHAVVGLSTSLRAEAAQYGIRVSVVCPGFIDTPLFDSPALGLPPNNRFKARAQRIALAPEACAERVLAGVARNRAVIPVTDHAWLAWGLVRWAPGLVHALARWVARQLHRERTDAGR